MKTQTQNYDITDTEPTNREIIELMCATRAIQYQDHQYLS